MNCKELGYKVGDEFEIIHFGRSAVDHGFKEGEKVTLVEDDGDDRPRFSSGGKRFWVYLTDVKPLEKTMDIKEAYKVMAQNCGIKVGDTVKVLRLPETGEMGWTGRQEEGMKYVVNKKHTIDGHDNGGGFSLDNCMYNYPFFVLEKIKSGIEPIELEDYTVQFKEGGTIEVGCQTIDFETIKKIYDRAKSTL